MGQPLPSDCGHEFELEQLQTALKALNSNRTEISRRCEDLVFYNNGLKVTVKDLETEIALAKTEILEQAYEIGRHHHDFEAIRTELDKEHSSSGLRRAIRNIVG